MINLFYLNEYHANDMKKSEFDPVFKYGGIREGDSILNTGMVYNHLLFLKDGLIKINCDEFYDRQLKKEQCILIPKGANISLTVLQSGSLLVFIFDMLKNPFENHVLHSYQTIQSKISYTFTPVPIREPLTSYLELILYYKEKGMDHKQLYEIKERELFLLLHSCYTQEEVITLLYPIIRMSNFKNFVIKNYPKVKNVAELVRISGMGRTAFDYTFRNVFGTSARQWMLTQIAKQVQYKAMEPEITIKDLIKEFKFDSASHFNRFCRKQFDCTPGELIKNSSKSYFS
ncbi:MAG: AraC family transcriptional regulator [Tannerellaceae bacterium]|jgi:AraC-like DNA-binding protein|nr:AraC family transcriptional regulator [Tannerellaceae bacterium]